MISGQSKLARRKLLGAAGAAALLAVGRRRAAAEIAPALTAMAEAARREGSVTLYSGYTPPQNAAVAAAFQARYGIPVNVVRIFGGPFMARYSAEQASGSVQADVVMQADQLLIRDIAAKNWLVALDKATMPATAAWPGDAWYERYAAVMFVPLGMAYNTRKLVPADQPATWPDLLKPQYHGQILLPDPRVVFSNLPNVLYLEKAFGTQFLRDLAKQRLAVSPGVVPGLQQIAAGEKSIIINVPPSGDRELVASGAPIRTIVPEMHSGFAHYAGVSANCGHPNAARLLLDFMLDREGQALLVKDAAYSGLDGVPGALTGTRPQLLDWTELAREKDRLIGLLDLA